MKAQVEFMVNGVNVIGLLFTVANKADLSELNSLTIEKTSNWLLQNIEKYPEAASVMGVGISIWLLTDSWSDSQEVNRIRKEYDDLLKTRPDDYKKREDYKTHMVKRSDQIRGQVIAFNSRQGRMATLKSMIAGAFSWVGLSTQSQAVKSMAYAASLFTGLGALINGYNWGVLHDLVHRLEQTGYIIIMNRTSHSLLLPFLDDINTPVECAASLLFHPIH